MNVISLCSGIGGLDLGVHRAVPSARTVGYVEWEPYAAAVLAARMESGDLGACPIYCDDLRRFDAAQWAGSVDCVTAGFPCQPFSVAGKQRGLADERWLWPEVWRITRDSQASVLFLENVPGVLRMGGAAILADLAAGGWSAEWDLFRASDVGAPQRRERWFCLAVADSGSVGSERFRINELVARAARGSEEDGEQRERDGDAALDRCGSLADADGAGQRSVGRGVRDERHDAWRGGALLGNAASQGLEGREQRGAARAAFRFPLNPGDSAGWSEWTGAQPVIRRDAAGLLGRLGRLKALGNAVVPAQAALAFRVLMQRL